jgi:hypothetical protein
MPQEISVHEASLSTFSVEIKAVIVARRQMTLSVFRQLHEEHLIDYVGEDPDDPEIGLLGKPWGLVNYFWKDLGNLPPRAVHVVWQKGNQLRRAIVAPFDRDPMSPWHLFHWDTLTRDLDAVLNFARAQNEEFRYWAMRLLEKGNLDLGMDLDAFQAYYFPPRYCPDHSTYVDDAERARRQAELVDHVTQARERLEETIAPMRTAWNALYEQLAGLEQLFIAV